MPPNKNISIQICTNLTDPNGIFHHFSWNWRNSPWLFLWIEWLHWLTQIYQWQCHCLFHLSTYIKISFFLHFSDKYIMLHFGDNFRFLFIHECNEHVAWPWMQEELPIHNLWPWDKKRNHYATTTKPNEIPLSWFF